MQVNKFVAIGAISLVSIGAIAWLNNVKYQEDKRLARLELGSAEIGCSSLSFNLKDAEFWRERVKDTSNKDKEKHKQYLLQSEQSVEESKKACQKIQEYQDKYER
ncbi:hypothetical protein [Pseudanabaena sp. ABRG5-3]|uniref:hypothetical protein n=1 Tax=Pseudanabaena sp. ABRG5-3 TaxID=685565 RepID=UPI000DC71D20|nr:hypothetical protein [Pseudanabaena sp. ABRG5-3]BBC22941.1 hypothetical protein ABRG53_0684 [Pseudanabaena sp. ABRG5-3]